MEKETQPNRRGYRGLNIFTITLNPGAIKLLEQNARYMKHEEFNRLVENVRRDGKLTSAPFLCKEGDKYLCLSGNHRTKAAIEAGLEEIVCLATDDELTEEQKIAIQLSHNAIAGQDDPATLKALYEKILDTDMKKYSGLDDKTLALMEKAIPDSISEASLQTKVISLIFLPSDLEIVKKEIEKALEMTNAEEIWLAYGKDYDRYLDSIEEAQASYGVMNTATAFSLVMSVFDRGLTLLQDGYIDSDEKKDNTKWVPLSTIFGNSKVPQRVAKKLVKVTEIMVGKGDIESKSLWQALEVLATDYLSDS